MSSSITIGTAAPRRKRPLFGVFTISALIHVAIIALLGGVVVFKVFDRPKAQFVPPPPAPLRVEPRKIEYKVKMQEQQRRGGRPTVSPRITANGIGDITMPEIKTDMQPLKERVKMNFKTSGVSGSGIGGIGTGSGVGTGLGLGMSEVNFLGVKAAGERIAILVDLSGSMLGDEKGGFDGFTYLKREISRVILQLPPGAFFNIIFFGQTIDVYKTQLVIANDENKQDGIKFMTGYYSDRDNPSINGLAGNYQPAQQLPAQGGTTRHDLALSAAIEFSADTIFIISDGNHMIIKPWANDAERLAAEKDYADKLKTVDINKINSADAAAAAAKNAERAKKGLPAAVYESGQSSGPSLIYPVYKDKDVIDFLNKLVADNLTAKGKPTPKIFCIGYVTTPPQESFLREISKEFKGRFRRINSLVRPIKD